MSFNSLKPFIAKEFKEQEKHFFDNSSLIAFKLNKNPILEIGLKNSMIINDQIVEQIKNIKQDIYVKSIYYFKETFDLHATAPDIIPRIPLYKYCEKIFPELLNSFSKVAGRFFIFIIIEFNFDISIKSKRTTVTNLAGNTSKILRCFFPETKTYISNSCGNNTINLLALNHGIYASYQLNSQNNKKKDNAIEQELVFSPFENCYTIKGFIEQVKSEIPKIGIGGYENLLKLHHFTAQTNRFYKYLREEYVVLMKYILYRKFNVNSEIRLGVEKEQWDAIISSNDYEEIVEITQALPNREHETRQALLEKPLHGYKGFSLKLRTIHQQGLDSYPKPIIDAITKKHQRNYPTPRVLIIVVLAEFAYNKAFILQEWIKEINKATTIGNFKKIYIAIDAMQFYELHQLDRV